MSSQEFKTPPPTDVTAAPVPPNLELGSSLNGHETKEALKQPPSPIFIHPGSGMVFYDTGGQQLSSGIKREVLVAFAQNPRIQTTGLRDLISGSGSPRPPATVLRDLNIFFREDEDKTKGVDKESDVFVVDSHRNDKNGIFYKTTRDIHIIEDHELAWAAVAYPDVNARTKQGKPITNEVQASSELGKPPVIKSICDTLGIYTYNGAYIKIPPGEQHAMWMMLFSTAPAVVSNRDLEALVDEVDPTARKLKLNARLGGLTELINALEGNYNGKKILKRSYIPETREYVTQLIAKTEREIPQNPSQLSAEQLAMLGNIFALRHREPDGLPLKIGRESCTYKLDGNIRPVIESLMSACRSSLDTNPQIREAMLRSRATALEHMRLFFNLSPAVQESFIRSHENGEIRKLLLWMRDENEKGQLQGIVHPFLAIDPATTISSDLYIDINSSATWIAPPEAIATRFIKRDRKVSRDTNGQELLVAFD